MEILKYYYDYKVDDINTLIKDPVEIKFKLYILFLLV